MHYAIASLAHVIVLIAGAWAVYVSTPDLRQQIKRLDSHVVSGSWEIQTDRPQIEKHVRANYGDLADRWKLSFVGAGGASFNLDNGSRKQTITDIGHRTISQSSLMQFNATPVYVAYGHLLSQLLYLIEPPRDDARAQDVLREVALAIERQLRAPDQVIDRSTLRRVNRILEKVPQTNVLKQALRDFDEFSKSRGVDFPAFDVDTKPSFDAAGGWDSSAVVMAQSNRCLGAAQSLGVSTEFVSVDVSFRPRILEVELARPWLSDALMNEAALDTRRSIREHFALGGDLSVIPWRLWVILPDQVEFQLSKSSDDAILRQMVNDNICCRIVCGTDSVPLKPQGVSYRNGYWISTRADKEPLLFAIASRSRQYQ